MQSHVKQWNILFTDDEIQYIDMKELATYETHTHTGDGMNTRSIEPKTPAHFYIPFIHIHFSVLSGFFLSNNLKSATYMLRICSAYR